MTEEKEFISHAARITAGGALAKAEETIALLKATCPKIFGHYFYLETILRLKAAENYIHGHVAGVALRNTVNLDGPIEVKIAGESMNLVREKLDPNAEIDYEIPE